MKNFKIIFQLISVLLVFIPATVSGINTEDTRMLALPAMSASQIAFVYVDDLWVANADGMQPSRLTAAGDAESKPVFSPNGNLVDAASRKHTVGIATDTLGILSAGEADNWQQNHPDWLWCDDFESADTALSNRYQDVNTNGFSIVRHDAFDGTRCLQQCYTQGQVNAGWIIRVSDQGFPDHIFMRWYHKFEAGFQGFPPKMARIRHRDRTTWKSTYAVHCWLETDGVLALDVAARNSSQGGSVGWLPIARSDFSFANTRNIGRWICFEMEVQLNTPGKSDGLYRLWADDTLLVERTNVDLRGNTSEKINEASLDCYWNGGSPKAQNRYYDNFVISTKRIGPYVKSGVNK